MSIVDRDERVHDEPPAESRAESVVPHATGSEAPVVASTHSADARAAPVYLLSRGPWLTVLRRALSIVSLVTLDICGLAIGLYAALVIRTLLYSEELYWSRLWDLGPGEWLPFLAPITVLMFLQAGLYNAREIRPGAGRIVASLVLVAFVVLAFGLGVGYDFTTSGLIPTAVATCAVAIGSLRAAYGSLSLELMRAIGARRRVVLMGDTDNVTRIHRQLSAVRGGFAYSLIAVVSSGDDAGLPAPLHRLEELPRVLEQERPDELILTESDFDERTLLRAVEVAHRSGVRVRLAPTTTELLVHEGAYVPGQGAPLFEVRPPILTGFDFALKRSFDIAVATLLAIVGLPVWIVVALAVKLESRGPILFVDRRVGVAEREFGMLKFRTMVAGAAEMQPRLEQLNEATGALFKIRDDPRVTRVGRVLRRLSIDELPQLVNVLTGTMSLVGPRPLPRRDHDLLGEWHKARYNVLPGMTGLWQISGRSALGFDDLVRLDFTYIENWSVWLDITIIAKTLPAIVSRRGAY